LRVALQLGGDEHIYKATCSDLHVYSVRDHYMGTPANED
jgi:hypothetical protein